MAVNLAEIILSSISSITTILIFIVLIWDHLKDD